MANRYLLDKIYGGLKTIICWIKRLFMCKTSTIVDSEDCYKLIHHILEDSIQRLYSSIDDFLFQDIERYKVQRLMPQWICDGGLCPELKISKGEFEKVRQKFSTPIFGRFIYYYDLWSIIAALQDRLEAVDSFMRSFYSKVPSTRKYKDSDYTAAGRMGGREETEVHVLLNSIFISLASTFDLLSKIAVEQNNITKYKDFSNYKKMESRDALFNIKKLAHEIDPSLTDKGMLFAENRVVRIIETFRNEYVHFAREAKIDLSLDPHDWYNNLKILEDSFVRSKKVKTNEIIVDFINPSVLDFIGHKLRQQMETVKLLIRNCYFMEQLYTMFSEAIISFYNWYCVKIDEDLYPDVLESFHRLLLNPRTCARDRSTFIKKQSNPAIFLYKIRDEYRDLCHRECLLEKTIKEEWLLDANCSISTRLSLIEAIQWDKVEIDRKKILSAIGEEDLLCAELSEYISMVKQEYEEMIVNADFVQKVHDTVESEIDSLATTAEANELKDSLDTIFEHMGEDIDKEELIEKLEHRTYMLEDIESEQADAYIEARNISQKEEYEEEKHIAEMFTSLRCE